MAHKGVLDHNNTNTHPHPLPLTRHASIHRIHSTYANAAAHNVVQQARKDREYDAQLKARGCGDMGEGEQGERWWGRGEGEVRGEVNSDLREWREWESRGREGGREVGDLRGGGLMGGRQWGGGRSCCGYR